MVPDKNGNLKDVVLGFDSIADYQNIPSDFGASLGRYANRINKGVIVTVSYTHLMGKEMRANITVFPVICLLS